MYSRVVDKKVLTFGHEGVLYKNSFIFYDKQTDSKWIHVTGTAVKGKYKGTRLEMLPSTLTTWKEWKAIHPKTRVLSGRGRGGFMGTYRGQVLRSFGLRVEDGKTATYYPFLTLKKKKVVSDRLGDKKLVVVFSPDSAAAIVWDRGDREFESSSKGEMKDKKTGSVWSILKGECTSGELKGKKLKQVYGVAILKDRFHAFWPKGKVYR